MLKNYCGGPTSAIFATIDLDPLYFVVHMFLAPSDPPYMSENIVVHREKFYIGNVCQICLFVTKFSLSPESGGLFKIWLKNGYFLGQK